MKNSPTGFTMIKKEVIMKKIFALLIYILFASSAFAACSLDIDKPCTANSNNTQFILPKTANQNSEFADNNTLQDDDSDCQFGVCLPQKTEEIDIPDKKFKHN